jgi:hypothetical protein
MVDCQACGQIEPTEFRHVDCAALWALRQLLSTATGERGLIQAQHRSSSSGDADAQPTPSRTRQDELVSPPAKLTELSAEVRQKMV